MSVDDPRVLRGLVVEEEVRFSLVELCQTCAVSEDDIRAWVFEGLLQPEGDGSGAWIFRGASLRRARVASRLARDLELNLAGIALALDLLDEIAALRLRLAVSRGSDDDREFDPED